MKDAIRFDVENGYYLFKLEKVLHTRNISINKLMRDTNTDLARICDYLDCKITDIIEYFPNQKADKEAG